MKIPSSSGNASIDEIAGDDSDVTAEAGPSGLDAAASCSPADMNDLLDPTPTRQCTARGVGARRETTAGTCSGISDGLVSASAPAAPPRLGGSGGAATPRSSTGVRDKHAEQIAVERAVQTLPHRVAAAGLVFKLNSNVEVNASTELLPTDPWLSWAREQEAQGHSVYWVTLNGKLHADKPRKLSRENLWQLASGDATVRYTVPVLIPAGTDAAATDLSAHFRKGLEKALATLPLESNAAPAAAANGPWELVVGRSFRQVDNGTGLQLETLARIRHEPGAEALTIATRRQCVPQGAGPIGKKVGNESARLETKLEEGLQLYQVHEELFRLPLAHAADRQTRAAFARILRTGRAPRAGRGLTRISDDRRTRVGLPSKLRLNVACGPYAAFGVEAKIERLPEQHPSVALDDLRREQARVGREQGRPVVYEHVSYTAAPSLAGSLTASIGPARVGIGASARAGTLEESIVARPASLLAAAKDLGGYMHRVPQSAEEYLRGEPGNQYRTLTFGTTSGYVEAAAALGAQAGGVGATVSIGASATMQQEHLLDFRRTCLPNGHLLVDLRLHDLKKLGLRVGVEASVKLFERSDARDLLEAHGMGALAGPAAKLVEQHLGGLKAAAEMTRTIKGESCDEQFLCELDMNLPAHREVFELLRRGDTSRAAKVLAKVAGGSDAASKGEAATPTVPVNPENGMILHTTEERRIEREVRWRSTVKLFFRQTLRPLSFEETAHDAYRTGGYFTNDGNGGTKVVEIRERERVYVARRQFFGLKRTAEYGVVSFKSRERDPNDPTASYSERVAFLYADHPCHELLSRRDVDDFKAFVKCVGGTPTADEVGRGNWLTTLFGAKHGVGDIRVRVAIPTEGVERLSNLTPNEIWRGAGVIAGPFAGEPDAPPPAWAVSEEARAALQQWLRVGGVRPPERHRGEAKAAEERYIKASGGRTIWQDYVEGNRSRCYAAAADALSFWNVMKKGERSDGLGRTSGHAGWELCGRKWGHDWRMLALIRQLLVKPGEAQDLFYIETMQLKGSGKGGKTNIAVQHEGDAPTKPLTAAQTRVSARVKAGYPLARGDLRLMSL